MTVSRQRQWQKTKRAQGRCERCGSLRDCKSVGFCRKCLAKERDSGRTGKLRRYKCGRCGAKGHNRRTCNAESKATATAA